MEYRCKNCRKEKDLAICWDCYWAKVIECMGRGDLESQLRIIKWLVEDNLSEVILKLENRLAEIEKILKIKLPKSKAGRPKKAIQGASDVF